MKYMNQNSKSRILIKIIFAIIILVFLTFSIFGLIASMNSMRMDSNGLGTMNDCFFGLQGHVCNMTLAQHISIWQGISAMSLQNVVSLDLLMLGIMAILLVATLGRNLFFESRKLTLQYHLYTKQNLHILPLNYLQEAFSQGILNSKIYPLAI